MAIHEENTITSAEGISKKVYGDVRTLVPNSRLKVTRRFKFDGKRKVGKEFSEQIWLSNEHGVTFGGSGGGRRNLNRPSVAVSKLATLRPTTVHFRSEVTIDLLKEAQSKGDAAFESTVAAMMRNCKRSMETIGEEKYNFGGTHIGAVSTSTDGGTSSTVVITENTFAPGVWLGSVGKLLDFYNGSTQLNTDGVMEVTSYNPKTRTIVVYGTSADVDRIVAATTSARIYTASAYGNQGLGLKAIASLNSSSGNYLGIATGDYQDVWNATQVTWDASETEFSWGLLNEGIQEMVQRGGSGDLIAYASHKAWRHLCNSLDALRVLDSSYSAKKQEMGHHIDSLSYHTLSGGKVTIEPSDFCMQSDVIVVTDPESDDVNACRIGTAEMEMGLPGQEGRFFLPVSGTNVCEFGMFGCDDIWLPSPRSTLIFTP
jgi:hypothetical protein